LSSKQDVARKLFGMALYGNTIAWKGKAIHDNSATSESADINLLSREETDASIERAMANNPWTAAELAAKNKAAIGQKTKLKHGARISRGGIYSGLYGSLSSDIENEITGLKG
jgi:hypothetical protein